MIGPYRLLQRVGEGGMGEVWLAEQTHPVRRQLALKVIKAGMDTAHVVARFEAERQALAVMDHPAIAKVFDAGATPQGRPYFLMEYVRGEAITTYCNRHRLSTRDRLDLFLQVCDGVQHAHQKGVIHRDLKPSNILVTLLDGRPVPKVIDFGVAKAITQPLTGRTLFTEMGTLIGTPEYMSPEQAEMSGLDIDTRTDVYALGAILYELLTGVLPFESKTLREKGLDEIRRTIREVDPPRPSVRVTPAALTHPPHSQRPDVTGLASRLRGDLDWITMRAIEKDRTRRYGSAADLAADLRRHLDNLPVVASPPSTLYRMSKFVRRHRAGVTVAVILIALLVAFAATTGVQARRVARERDRANREAETAKAVNDFLQNDLLAQASASAQSRPDTRPDPDLKVRTALDRAAVGIEGKFQTQPLVEASIRLTIGKTYEDLGLYPEAERHVGRALDLRRRVLGDEDATLLTTMSDMARVYIKEAKYDQADGLLTKSLETARRLLGEQHPQTLTILSGLGRLYMLQGKHSQAEPLYIKVLDGRRRVLGEQHPDTLTSMDDLASLYWRQGKYAEAEPVRRKVVELQRRVLGEEHPEALTSMNNLALLSSYQGKYAEAEALFTHVLGIMRRVLGEDHLETMISAGNLGIVYFRQGRYAEAETLFTRVLEQKQRVLGAEHPETLTSMNNLAVLYRAEGKYSRAEPLYVRVMEVQRRVLGDEHPNMLLTMNGLALLYGLEGKNAQAELLYTKVLETQRRVLGEEHPDTIGTMSNLAVLYVNEGKNAEAEPLSTKTVEVRRRVLGEQHPDTMRSIDNLGLLYLNVGKSGQAESLLRSALSSYEKVAPDSWERHKTESMLGASLAGQLRYAEAEPLLLSGYEGMLHWEASIPASDRADLERAGARLVKFYRDWGRPEKASEWTVKLRQSATIGPIKR
jgi:non-specific serine/threonine protein kinase/serine/threonine-protein kinase